MFLTLQYFAVSEDSSFLFQVTGSGRIRSKSLSYPILAIKCVSVPNWKNLKTFFCMEKTADLKGSETESRIKIRIRFKN